MSKSNWNGSASWGTIEDPTGALHGRVLVVTAGACASSEDYLVQYAGTSDTFSKAKNPERAQDTPGPPVLTGR